MENSQTANKPLGPMALGDLVVKINGRPPGLELGIIIELNRGIAKVYWTFGTFLTPTHTLKLFTSS